MDVLPLGLTGDGALRAAVAADREVTRMEGVKLDHLAQYLAEMREAYVPPPVRLPGEEPLTYTGYEAPPKLKEQLALLNAGYCTFPHCHRRARPSDVDHQQTHGTGGQTASKNTHRLCRKHHRAKDKGRWRVVSPAPGMWIWESPAGAIWLVTNGVTTPLNGILSTTASFASPARRGDGDDPDDGRPTGYPLTPDEYDVTYGFIDTS